MEFALTEACHAENAAFLGRAGQVANLVRTTYESLLAELKRKLKQVFRKDRFRPEATTNEIRTAMPTIHPSERRIFVHSLSLTLSALKKAPPENPCN